MKTNLFIYFLCIFSFNAFSQTNWFPTSGNAGIGTGSSPAEKLHIKGNVRIDGVSGFTHSELVFYRADGAKFASIGQGDLAVSNSTFDIKHFNGNDIRFMQSGVEALRILANGRVGIGTTTPQARLEVAGGVSFTGGRLYQAGDIPNDNNAQFYNNSTTGYGLYSQGGGSGRYAFHFLNKDGTSILYGKGDGSVGIGTYNPDAKLTVKGNIHAEEVKVDLSVPAPDYVFEPTYTLPTLAEVETYIQENKHLPEIPAAKEMEQNGVHLGEMNMLLLKKVEELTLYVIELKKENEKQNRLINELVEKK